MTPQRSSDDAAVLTALAAEDGVVILATDTVPGLHARLDRPRALARLSELKRRPPDRTFLVLCGDIAAARSLAAPLPAAMARYLDALWPGPFTAIVPAAAGLPSPVVSARGAVAIRVPDRRDLRSLLEHSGPLASSSANLSGAASATDLSMAVAVFPGLPVWEGHEATRLALASALVDLGGTRPVLLRPGPRDLPDWEQGA